jgi:uncharacterized membrane protein YhhN
MILLLPCAAFAIDVLFMMFNFLLSRNRGYGRYPVLFVITKTLLVPLVALIWYQVATNFDRKVIIYIILCWLGDLCLLARFNAGVIEWVISDLGSLGFFIAHIVMISYFDIAWSRIPIWTPICAIPCAIFCLKLLPHLKCPNLSQKCVTVYYIILQLAYVCAIMRASVFPVWHPSYLMCAIGYFLLVISDSFLLAREFGVTKNERRCEVMLSYGVAELLIVLGCGLRNAHISLNTAN